MLVSNSRKGWALNRINCGKPYHVELVGPYKLPQVEDSRGTVALSGPGGSVFCMTETQSRRLCALANGGRLPTQGVSDDKES